MKKLDPKYYHLFCLRWRTLLESEHQNGFVFNATNIKWLKENASAFNVAYASFSILWYHNRAQGDLFCANVDFEKVPYSVAYKILRSVLRDKKLNKKQIMQLAKKYPL